MLLFTGRPSALADASQTRVGTALTGRSGQGRAATNGGLARRSDMSAKSKG